MLGVLYYENEKYPEAIDKLNKAICYYDSISDKTRKGKLLNTIGNIYKFQCNYEIALKYYHQSLNFCEKIKDSSGIAIAHIGIANVFINWKNYDKALENYKICFQISKNIGKNNIMSSAMIGMGNVYKQQKKDNEAIKSYENSLAIEKDNNNPEGIALALLNMGDVYFNQENYYKALTNYQNALKIVKSINNNIRVSLVLLQIGQTYQAIGNNAIAEKYYKNSIDVATKIDYNQVILEDFKNLYLLYKKQNRLSTAIEFYEKYNNLKDTLFTTESQKQINEIQTKYETGKKEQEIQLLNKDKQLSKLQIKQSQDEINKQRILIYSIVIVLILISVFSILLFRLYKEKKKANKKLSDLNQEILMQKEEIITQRDEIEAQRDIATEQRDLISNQKNEITDSIYYARRIQQALLPITIYLNEILDDYFILFKPRNIVSGDFYWARKIGNKTIIAAADCTGHGVPGAFMSMLGIAFLKEITNKGIVKPDIILNELKELIILSLHQRGMEGDTKDGMDISLCSIDKIEMQLEFAGANNPIYIVKNEEFKVESEEIIEKQNLPISNFKLYELKGDKMPIGYFSENYEVFTNKEVTITKNDMVYLFSDGYADQFGGKNNKKYKYKALKELITNSSNLNCKEQKDIISSEFEKWKGNFEQTDDILVIGIRI
ncbi:MAG: tetratricopeptide repeat protein [Bacteroidia bacterium]|nr:tetratricopeptide repeat protein [Bacteroidia bacterium]